MASRVVSEGRSVGSYAIIYNTCESRSLEYVTKTSGPNLAFPSLKLFHP